MCANFTIDFKSCLLLSVFFFVWHWLKYSINHKSFWLLFSPELGTSVLKNVWFFLGGKFFSFVWRLNFSKQWGRHFPCSENCTVNTACLQKQSEIKNRKPLKPPAPFPMPQKASSFPILPKTSCEWRRKPKKHLEVFCFEHSSCSAL